MRSDVESIVQDVGPVALLASGGLPAHAKLSRRAWTKICKIYANSKVMFLCMHAYAARLHPTLELIVVLSALVFVVPRHDSLVQMVPTSTASTWVAAPAQAVRTIASAQQLPAVPARTSSLPQARIRRLDA